MSESSTFIQWLLLGGLFCVIAGLGAALYALRLVLRRLAEHAEQLGAMAQAGAARAKRLEALTAAPDLAETLREEWQTFMAIYRADWASTVAEARLTKALEARAPAPEAPDALERAILMAQAGRSVQAIMAECGLARMDAEAMVHFHQPRQSLAS